MPSPILCAVVLLVYVFVGLFAFSLCAMAAWSDQAFDQRRMEDPEWEELCEELERAL